ncbi:MAG TPA: peptidoglycan-binding domain-containing protein, partial [Pilimelia sp.]|nr:peptidoglycan-binding domain-containing protein [Pilimelia sp.]
VVRRGGTLLRADERPVLLLYGEVPMYRSLAVGAEGRDVRQLERNLSALGYRGFTVDETFSAATATAVKAWQRDLELPETGVVDRPWVVYAPGAVRVADRLVRLGAPAAADVLSYTSTVRAVTVRADAGDVTWAAPGARVTVELPDGARTAGRVTGVSDQVGAGDGAGSGDGGGDTGGGERAATVAVGVAVPDQKALGRTARAPVRVRYVAQERKNVLAVPVGALLALAEGGYGLELVTGATRRLVAVAVGLFADGLVEVSGAGVAEGSTVGTAG